MMWHTHAAIGASSVWLLLPFMPPDSSGTIAVLTAYAVIGSLVPDMDAADSKIKHVKVAGVKPLVPVARALNRDLGHRGLLHSLYGWGMWTLLVLPLSAKTGWLPVAALSLSYASHLVGDAATKRGIPLFHPRSYRWHVVPRKLWIVTGSDAEELVFVVFSLLVIDLLLGQLKG